MRVKASVVRVLNFSKTFEVDALHTLKEIQPRLQLTERQFNFWARKTDMQLVEFESAHKIRVIQVASRKTTGRVDWIAFEAISQITER